MPKQVECLGPNSPMKTNYSVPKATWITFLLLTSILFTHAQSQLILNGGFEAGFSAPAWTLGGGAGIATVPPSYVAHSGTNSLYLGGFVNEIDYAYQNFALPAGTTSATVSFWYYIHTSEIRAGVHDTMTASIRN